MTTSEANLVMISVSREGKAPYFLVRHKLGEIGEDDLPSTVLHIHRIMGEWNMLPNAKLPNNEVGMIRFHGEGVAIGGELCTSDQIPRSTDTTLMKGHIRVVTRIGVQILRSENPLGPRPFSWARSKFLGSMSSKTRSASKHSMGRLGVSTRADPKMSEGHADRSGEKFGK